jgi:hypothetical protein
VGEPWVHGFRLVDDGRRLLTFSSHGSSLWDLTSGERVGASEGELCPREQPLGAERSLCLHGGVRRYVDDGGQTLLTAVSEGGGAWFAWTPDGRFDHAEGGLRLVTFVRSGRPCDPAACARGRRARGLLDALLEEPRGAPGQR